MTDQYLVYGTLADIFVTFSWLSQTRAFSQSSPISSEEYLNIKQILGDISLRTSKKHISEILTWLCHGLDLLYTVLVTPQIYSDFHSSRKFSFSVTLSSSCCSLHIIYLWLSTSSCCSWASLGMSPTIQISNQLVYNISSLLGNRKFR